MNRSAPLALAILLAAGAVQSQVLLTIDGTSDAVLAFDRINGSLISASLFPVPNTTQVGVIDVNGEIWITEQTGDRITRRDVTGAVLATIGPTFPGGAFDNIRGLAFVGGIVYVTNFGSQNGAIANSVVMLDATGNHLSTFSVNTLATNPFAVLAFQGDILVSGFSNTTDVFRFTLAGVPVGVFHDSATISPAHGLAQAGDGNVWCVGFTTANVCKLHATTGAVISSFAAPSSPRGVYELGNGNVMWTNANGVNIYDVTTQTSSLVFPGVCNHIALYGGGGGALASAIPFGTGCDGLALVSAGTPQLGNAGFGLRVNNVPAASPVGLFGFGTLVVNPGVDLTIVGMPGCFAYTNLDLGLFTGSLVAGGSSTLPLPIPNTPALGGFTLSSQGVSFSTLTPLGLAASNGLTLVLGY